MGPEQLKLLLRERVEIRLEDKGLTESQVISLAVGDTAVVVQHLSETAMEDGRENLSEALEHSFITLAVVAMIAGELSRNEIKDSMPF